MQIWEKWGYEKEEWDNLDPENRQELIDEAEEDEWEKKHGIRIGEDPKFWDWVVAQKITDDPRGDFISDTISVLECGKKPQGLVSRMCFQAHKEYADLRKEY